MLSMIDESKACHGLDLQIRAAVVRQILALTDTAAASDESGAGEGDQLRRLHATAG